MKLTRISALTTLVILIGIPAVSLPESVAEKASAKRREIIMYLRALRPMVYNFPCEPYPACAPSLNPPGAAPAAQGQGQQPGQPAQQPAPTQGGQQPAQNASDTRIKAYQEIKRVYQEGIVYFFEGNYINAYYRFLDSQSRTEELLEGLSQSYLDRTEIMLRDAIEKKYPDDEQDMTVVDISIEFGPESKLRRDFKINRVAPNDTRRYNPKLYHYVLSKYNIERNTEMGYRFLGQAREARLRAMMVDNNLAPGQTLQPHHRQIRIENYIKAIELCRQAKRNAENIYQLKYPYDNCALLNLPDNFRNPRHLTDPAKNPGNDPDMFQVDVVSKDIQGRETTAPAVLRIPSIEHRRMNWYRNPYINPENMHPIFDLRLPAQYRRDAVDTRMLVYPDEVDVNLNFRFHREKPADLISD